MTYEDNKTKRSTLPVVAGVRALASDLCLMDGLTENTVGSGVEANSMTRVAETTALAHGASETATAKSG